MTLSAIILLAVLIPMVLSATLSLHIVQNVIVGVATKRASEFLGAEVSIGKIDVTMLGEVQVGDLLVRDLDCDTLLYVDKLKSRIVGLLPATQQFNLGKSRADGVVFNLRQTERGDMNIREIVLKLIPEKPSSKKTAIHIGDVAVENMRMTIEQQKHMNPSYGVDMRNIRIYDMSASAKDLLIDGSMIHGVVEYLNAREHSGFEVQSLSGELYLTAGALALSGVELVTGWSSLKLNELMLVGSSWGDFRDFNNETEISVDISDGYLSSDDLAYFAPAMRNWGVNLSDIALSATGEVADMLVSIDNISYGEETSMSAKMGIKGLPDIENTFVDLDLVGLTTSESDLSVLIPSVTSKPLSQSDQAMLSRLGYIRLTGGAKGQLLSGAIDLNGELESDIGSVTTAAKLNRVAKSEGVEFGGNIDLRGFDVGAMMAFEPMGKLSMATKFDGAVTKQAARNRLAVNSAVESVVINNTNFGGITLAADVVGRDVAMHAASLDPRLRFNVVADVVDSDLWGQSDALPSYDVTLDLDHFDLFSLGLDRRDSLSQITTHVDLQAAGRDLDRGSLVVDVSGGEYCYDADTLDIGQVLFEADSDDDGKEAWLTSDFVEAEFQSQSSISDILGFVRGALRHSLPALYGDPHDDDYEERIAMMDDKRSSQLKIKTINIDPLANVFVPGLQVSEGSSLNLAFDEGSHVFDLALKSRYVEHGSLLAIAIDSDLSNSGDSLTLRSSLGELYVGSSRWSGTKLVAGANNNNITLNSNFMNPTDSAHVRLDADMKLRREGKDLGLNIEILPSEILRGTARWGIKAHSIDLTPGRVSIDHFTMNNRNQRLSIDGIASDSEDDSVAVLMNNFDLSILSNFIAQLGYNIQGLSNGEIVASSMMSGAKLEAAVELDSVRVNSMVAPPMAMDMTWDSRLNRARMILENRNTRDTLVRGYYIPSEVKYYAQLSVDSLNMGLLDPPLGGVVMDTKGLADVRLTLEGEHREADLTGEIEVKGMETTVAYTNVRYRLPSAKIAVHNNNLTAKGVDVYDRDGGRGVMALSVDLQHLSNIAYSLEMRPNNMLVLDTKEGDNDSFYGTIYGSGLARIIGDRSGVKMTITASSAPNSHFYMPLMSKSDVTSVDFIKFVKPRVVDSLDVVAQRRRRFVERASGGTGSLKIDMSLDVQPNVDVQLVIDPTVGDIIKARGEGRLNLSLEPKANKFEIYGDYTISEGSYLFTLQNIVNKMFVIEPESSIQWSGSPTNAKLNIDAIYQLKASLQPILSDESTRTVPVDCIIHLSDMLTRPDVSFDIELPSSDSETQSMFNNIVNDQEAISRQFFYLMIANSFIPEATGAGSDIGTTATAATGFELLTNQLSNWLSTNDYNVMIRYRPESEMTGEEVDFGFSKGLINNRLLVEVEGNYLIDNKQATSENVSNFMGEAYVTWLIDQAGALRLRGFTQTIDRYDENQGLQETGIGVYYRESFDNFRDLRARVRERFAMSDERRERKRRRGEAKEAKRTNKKNNNQKKLKLK